MKRPPVVAETIDAVNIISLCKAYGTLPLQGGMLDQDSLMVHYMGAYADAEVTRQQMEQRKAR